MTPLPACCRADSAHHPSSLPSQPQSEILPGQLPGATANHRIGRVCQNLFAISALCCPVFPVSCRERFSHTDHHVPLFLFLTQGRGLSLSRFSWVGDKCTSTRCLSFLTATQLFCSALFQLLSGPTFLPIPPSLSPAASAAAGPSFQLGSRSCFHDPGPRHKRAPRRLPWAPPQGRSDSTYEKIPDFLPKGQMRKNGSLQPACGPVQIARTPSPARR